MADIKSMINSLVQGNQEDAMDQFNQIFSMKAADALDSVKRDVAQVAFEHVEALEEVHRYVTAGNHSRHARVQGRTVKYTGDAEESDDGNTKSWRPKAAYQKQYNSPEEAHAAAKKWAVKEEVEDLEEGGKSRDSHWVKGQDAGGTDRIDQLRSRGLYTTDPSPKKQLYTNSRQGVEAAKKSAAKNVGALKQKIKDDLSFNRHRAAQTAAKLPG